MKKLLFVLLLAFVLIGCNTTNIDGPVDEQEELEEVFSVLHEVLYLNLNEGIGIPIHYDNIEDDRIQISFSNESIIEYYQDTMSFKVIDYGYTKIFIEVMDSEFKGEIEVYVEANEVKAPVIKPTNNHINVGSKFAFFFENKDKVGAGVENFDYTFNDESFAEIDDNHFITPLKPGELVVTAKLRTNPSITSSFTVMVVEETDESRLIITTEDSVLRIKPGETAQVLVDGKKEDMALNYAFHSYTNDIASISSEGKIIGTKEGVAYFKVTNKSTNKPGYFYIIIDKGVNTQDYMENMVSLAESQEGYRPSVGKYTKYGEWFLPTYAYYDWCAMFVSWNANEVGIPNKIIIRSASVSDIRDDFVRQNRFQLKEEYHPKRGDLIIFLSEGASHIGIVTGSDSERVYTIEGNTSNMVARRSYSLDYGTITGYATPDYTSLNK